MRRLAVALLLLLAAPSAHADSFFGGSGGSPLTTPCVSGAVGRLLYTAAGLAVKCDTTSPQWDPATGTYGLTTPTGRTATITTPGADTDISLNLHPKGLDDGNFANTVFISPLSDPDLAATLAAVENRTSPSLLIESNSDNTSGELVILTQSTSGVSPITQIMTRGSLTAPTVVHSGDIIGDLRGEGYDGAHYQPGARVTMEVDGTPGVGDMPGSINFWTTLDGTTDVVKSWSIGNSGNLTSVGAGRKVKLQTDGEVDWGTPTGNCSSGARLFFDSTVAQGMALDDAGCGDGLFVYQGGAGTADTNGVTYGASSINTAHTGAGTPLDFSIVPEGMLSLYSNGSFRWSVAKADPGSLLAHVDGGPDIGASGANRPGNYYGAGFVDAASGFKVNGTAGVSCSVGVLNPVTAVITNGIITHC